jgi:hypothetical protein
MQRKYAGFLRSHEEAFTVSSVGFRLPQRDCPRAPSLIFSPFHRHRIGVWIIAPEFSTIGRDRLKIQTPHSEERMNS